MSAHDNQDQLDFVWPMDGKYHTVSIQVPGRITFGINTTTQLQGNQIRFLKPQLTRDERTTLASIANVATQDEAYCIRVIERLTGEKIISRD